MVEAITQIVSKFGSFPNGKKFLFLVKLHFEDKACDIFGTQTSTSQPLVELPLRITGICQSFQQTKVNYWIDHIEKLALIVKSQPHVAYSAWTSRKMTYALRSSQFTSETL